MCVEVVVYTAFLIFYCVYQYRKQTCIYNVYQRLVYAYKVGHSLTRKHINKYIYTGDICFKVKACSVSLARQHNVITENQERYFKSGLAEIEALNLCMHMHAGSIFLYLIFVFDIAWFHFV